MIGDIQGCFDTLQRLLERLRFDESLDRLWFCGDLVNRGPKSLEVLRFVRSLGESARMVLGNHDLHLIACALGARSQRPGDTLDRMLEAPDCGELVQWLKQQPFMLRLEDWVLVHAGLHPSWTLQQAAGFAQRGSELLRKDKTGEIAASMRSPDSAVWTGELSGEEAVVAACAIMVRIRTCDPDGVLSEHNGPPDAAPSECRPWFEYRESEERTICFGHWSALGVHLGERHVGLDSGCVWGRSLTAIDVSNRRVVSEPSVEPRLKGF